MLLMRKIKQLHARHLLRLLPFAGVLVGIVLLPIAAQAAGSPWENAVDVLQRAFTGPIARGLSLVSIVWGGLMFAFAQVDSKRMLAGSLFRVGMSTGAFNFLAGRFPHH